MRHHLGLSLVIVSALASTTPFSAAQMGRSAAAEGQATQQQPLPQDDTVRASGMKLTVSTQLVQVDVVVHDGNGRPVHGLKASDFQVSEDKKAQNVRSFEEHTSNDPLHAKPADLVKLGPGMFTDYTPVPDNAPLTVILIDRLNTSNASQSYLFQQLRAYLKKAEPTSLIAIFGLNLRLTLIQGFSSDPKMLLAARDGKVSPQNSALLSKSGGTSLSEAISGNDAAAGLSDGTQSENEAIAGLSANLRQFEAEEATFETRVQVLTTLGALDQLAAYLSGFPGRKNVIWLSGSFPLAVRPDSSVTYSLQVQDNFSDEVKLTTNLLARARVAVYPIDVNGVYFDSGGAIGFGDPRGMVRALNTAGDKQNQLHNTMNQLANETGGEAFYGSNDLVAGVVKSLASGSDYYTLTYTPSNHNDKGGYRTIRVQLANPGNGRGLKLSYRRGYYLDPAKNAVPLGGAKPVNNARQPDAADRFARDVMQRGAPTPSDILFKVRVLASAPEKEDSNTQRALPSPPGAQRYDIDFTSLANRIDMPLGSDGHHHGAVEFVTFIYDGEGKLLGRESQTVHLDLTPESYASVQRGGIAASEHVTASAKARSLRIGVHDLSSGRIGVVEVPLASVSHLDPAP